MLLFMLCIFTLSNLMLQDLSQSLGVRDQDETCVWSRLLNMNLTHFSEALGTEIERFHA